MRSSHATAVWIFERVGIDVALAGDLLEERAAGRSSIWYWRQVLIAIWTSIWAAIFGHKVLALRALATGYVVNGVWLFLWQEFLHLGLPVKPAISPKVAACWFILLCTQIGTGWIVGRTHRTHAIPMVGVFIMWLLLWYPGSFEFHFGMLRADSVGQARFYLYVAGYLVWAMVPLLMEVAGLLIGATVAARRRTVCQ